MASCPCCSKTMLRKIRHPEVYWWCRPCWSEMPLLRANSNILTVLAEDLALYRQKNLDCPRSILLSLERVKRSLLHNLFV